MKKVLAFLMVLVLSLSMSFSVLASSDKSRVNGQDSTVTQDSTTPTGDSTQVTQDSTTVTQDSTTPTEDSTTVTEKSNLQKQFKLELNTQKKELAKQAGSLEEQKLQLQAQYEQYLASGDTTNADATLAKIKDLDTQMAALQTEMKKIINERYMVTKTMYSEEELAQFDSAATLIKQMYADASVLGAGSVTVKNNLIKFDAPAYVKGGRTLVPVRAITEGLGAEVNYDPETQSVTISKDGIVVVITINSTTVSVTQPATDPTTVTDPATDSTTEPVTETETLDVAATATCGRTYVPLRFLAETFGLDVNWDGKDQAIDIEEGTDDTTSETTGDTTTTDTTNTDSGTTTDATGTTDTTTTVPQ